MRIIAKPVEFILKRVNREFPAWPTGAEEMRDLLYQHRDRA